MIKSRSGSIAVVASVLLALAGCDSSSPGNTRKDSGPVDPSARGDAAADIVGDGPIAIVGEVHGSGLDAVADTVGDAPMTIVDAIDASSLPTDLPDGGGVDASETTPTLTPCQPDANARLICELSKVQGIPWGPVITVASGTVQPPIPVGGTIIPGDYQLVSETMYGNVPPDVSIPSLGLQIQKILHVEDGVMNEMYQATSGFSSGSGGSCARLVPRALSLLEVTGGCMPDSASYTMRGHTLVLTHLTPYNGYLSPCNGNRAVLGWYITVDELAPVGEAQASPSASSEVDAGSIAATARRDPRCPDNPPASGDPCTPDPGPLECEYGGDASRGCTTLALCLMDTQDGSFHFQLTTPSTCTPSNPPACPASFSAASALASTIVDAGTGQAIDAAGAAIQFGLFCSYAEGECACVRLRGPANSCVWTCLGGQANADGGTSSCPWPRPLAGDPCSPGPECNYLVQCTPDYIGTPHMFCASGYWEQSVTYPP